MICLSRVEVINEHEDLFSMYALGMTGKEKYALIRGNSYRMYWSILISN